MSGTKDGTNPRINVSVKTQRCEHAGLCASIGVNIAPVYIMTTNGANSAHTHTHTHTHMSIPHHQDIISSPHDMVPGSKAV